MKRVFKIKNLGFIIIFVLINMIMLNVNASTTWCSGGTHAITIERTITNSPLSTLSNTFQYSYTANNNNPASVALSSANTSLTVSGSVDSSGSITKSISRTWTSAPTYSVIGDYYYTLAEASTGNATLYPLSSTTYKILVSVENALDSNDHPTGDTVACMYLLDSNNNKVSNYKASFTGAVPSSEYGSFKLTKTVTGNAANKNEYFPVAIKIYAAGTYNITGLTALTAANSCTGSAQSATTTVTGAASNPTAKTICIKQGDQVIVGMNNGLNAIPKNTRIDVTETNNGYTSTTYKVNNGSAVTGTSLTNHSLAGGSQTTIAFTNTKTDNEWGKTGVLITTLPYIIIIAVAIIGLITYLLLKNKNKKEEIETI